MPDQSSTLVQPTGAVHPVAALFPMMSEEELDDLAADIAANGLVHPIVLDAEGTLIDGRNRQEACERAGVAPVYQSLNGHDPVAFILSNNVSRRHMNAGQRAMAVAKALSVSRNGTVRSAAVAGNASKTRVGIAKVVIDYATDLTDSVLTGARSLDDAYTEARRRKEDAESEAARMLRLRQEAPDLADLVDEERLTLAGALAELKERQERAKREAQERQKARDATTYLVRQAAAALYPGKQSPEAHALALLDDLVPGAMPGQVPLTPETFEQMAATLQAMISLWQEA